jgi:cobalt-zinc-cadmium efflux system membrane fusion protein
MTVPPQVRELPIAKPPKGPVLPPGRRRPVIAGGAAVLAALVLALLLRAQHRGAPQAEMPAGDEVWLSADQMKRADIHIADVAEQELPQAITAGGTIAFDDVRVTHVFSAVTGRVVRVLAQPGQRVKQGDPLAAIRSPDVGQAFSDVVKAQSDLATAEADYHRQEMLALRGDVSRRDYEAAKDNERKARAEHERALQKAALFRAGSLDSVTQDYLLRSAIDGEVVARAVNPGVEVQGQYSGGNSAELFTLGDIKDVWVYADVRDVDLPRIKVGDAAHVQAIAYPGRTFEGHVDWISGVVDPALRTARVRCALPNEHEELKPGMFATVFLVQPARRGLAVPRDAVVRINESTFVYVQVAPRPDGRLVFKRRPVSVGDELQGLVPVLDGLKAGERVVTEGNVSRDQPNDEVWVTPEMLRNAGITTATVALQPLQDAVALGGRLTFDDLKVSHVFSPASGRVTRLLAQPGQHVDAGTPLLAIRSPDVGQWLSDVVKAQADLVAAEHEVRRQRELYNAHAGAQRELEAAENTWHKAKAEADRAEQKVALLRAGDVDKVTQELVLRSPIAGEVIARNASVGLEVQGQYALGGNSAELFTIGDTDTLWLLGDVYEMDRPRIDEGDEVHVRVGAYPGRTFTGTVDWVSDVIEPVQRVAHVRCVIKNTDHLLRPEMYESLSIMTPGKRVLAVPRKAVMRVDTGTVVFVATGEKRPDDSMVFRRVKVAVNEEVAGDLLPVFNGLSPGEVVAVDHSILLLGLL